MDNPSEKINDCPYCGEQLTELHDASQRCKRIVRAYANWQSNINNISEADWNIVQLNMWLRNHRCLASSKDRQIYREKEIMLNSWVRQI